VAKLLHETSGLGYDDVTPCFMRLLWDTRKPTSVVSDMLLLWSWSSSQLQEIWLNN